MVKSINHVMQSIASEAYKKSGALLGEKTEIGAEPSFQREYLQVLVRDYFYSSQSNDGGKEKLGKLQKLKASIDSLRLPDDFMILQSKEELSLGSFLQMLEQEMQSFEENKEEKILEAEERLKSLDYSEMEEIVAQAKHELTLADIKLHHGRIMGKMDRKELPPEILLQIKKQFEQYGISATEEHEEMGRRLLERGINLDELTCRNVDCLLTAKNKELSQERVRELAEQYAQVQKIDLSSWNRELPLSVDKVKAIVEELQSLEGDYLQKIGRNFKSIEEALDNYRNFKNEIFSSEPKTNSQISFTYIRYQMTLEKALTLNSRGIAIDREELVKLEKELLRLELSEDHLAHTASVKGVSEDALLTEILQVEHGLVEVMGSDYGSISQMMTNFTFGQITGVAAQNQALLAMERYDQLGTKVRADLGDSMNKAIMRLQSLLMANDIEVTSDNLRAAAILGRAEVEINSYQIDRILEIDQKLQLVLNALNPKTVLDLMVEGQEILQMSLDELALLADDRENKGLQKMKDRIAVKINRLEKQGEISASDKETLILFYRLLHQIEKTEGAAAAFLLKEGREIQLENLYDAAKYLLHSKEFEKEIKEGMELTLEKELMDLKSQIKNGILAKKREIRAKLNQIGQELLDSHPEPIKESLALLKSLSLEDLEKLFQSFQNPSLADAEIYKEFHRIPFLLADSLRKLEKAGEKNSKATQLLKELRVVLGSAGEVDNQKVQTLLEEMEAELMEELAQEENTIFQAFMDLRRQWQAHQKFSQRQEFIQIPIWTNQQWHQINLYYPKEKQAEVMAKESIRALMAFDRGKKETVSLFVELSKDKNWALIQTDSIRLRKQLRLSGEDLAEIFKTQGLNLNELALGHFAAVSPYEKKDKLPEPEEKIYLGEDKNSETDFSVGQAERQIRFLARELAIYFLNQAD